MAGTERHFVRYLLTGLIGFLAVSGLWGGLILVINPSGSLMQLPVKFLQDSPFQDYQIPGIILFIFLGLFPTYVFYALIKKPEKSILNIFNLNKNVHFAWSFSFYAGIILILWIDFQVMFIGYRHFIQLFYGLLGVLITGLTVFPSVMNHYRKQA